jgi:predicted MFS family arabinose efflux permease
VQQTPVRILLALRPRVPAAVLLGSAISTVVFSATPFLLPAIAAEQDLNVGVVGLISTAQLGGFVLAAWGAGRFVRPRRRVLVIAAVIGVLVNVVSAVTPMFALLLVARFLSGIAIGLIDWIAWSEVFGNSDRTGDVAVIGPLVGTLSAPLLAVLIDARGSTWLFAALAALHVVPVLFLRTTHLDAAKRPRQERHRPTRGAAVLLACLGGLTLGGSAVFVYAAAIGLESVGMSALAVSLAFSLNALAAVPSARSRHRRRLSGAWVAVTGLMGVLITVWHVPPVFLVAMGVWGFAFWMAVPGAFVLLASRSRYPDERAGDAQAVMAFGRVLGPALGGLLYVNAPLVVLGLVGGGIVVVSGALMLYVEHRIEPIPSVQQIRARRTLTT